MSNTEKKVGSSFPTFRYHMTEYEYERTGQGILLKRCYGTGERIALPEEIEGQPVTGIAPYMFSSARQETDRASAICGDQIRELILPDSLKEIGRYAFYGCYQLERLTLSHKVKGIAGGAFTGCHRLKNLTFRMEHAEGYSMKEILSELHHELKVELCYADRKCTLLFPEYYEEAVENTPARLLSTQFHGAGYSYRQCFLDGVFQFGEYDRLFYEAQYLESEDFCIELALLRLNAQACQQREKDSESIQEGIELSEEAKGIYQSWLMEHRMSAGRWCLEFEQNEMLELLCSFIAWRREELEDLILEANQLGRIEQQSFLMDQKHRQFGRKKKVFEW